MGYSAVGYAERVNARLAVRPKTAASLALILFALTALLTGCSGHDDTPPSERPLTAAEATALATIRFNDYQRGVIPVKVAVRVNGDDVILAGDVDMQKHRGYATFQSSGAESSSGLIQWTLRAAAVLPNGADALMDPPPEQGWTSRPLDPSTSRLDTALAIVLNLSSDRPENASLLRQSGAAYLRSETVRGHDVDVFRGPSAQPTSTSPGRRSRSTYFVDDTGLLVRVVVDLAGDDAPLVIDLLDGTGKEVPLIPALEGD